MKQFGIFILMSSLLVTISQVVAAQAPGSVFEPAGFIYKNGAETIELYIKKAKNPCTGGSSENKFRLKMQNIASAYYRLGDYVSWKMELVNCNNQIVEHTVSVDLSEFNDDDWNESVDWIFNANLILKPIYDVRFSNSGNYAPDVVKGRYTGQVSNNNNNATNNQQVVSNQQQVYTNKIQPPATPAVRNNFTLMGYLHKDNQSSVELYIKLNPTKCGPNSFPHRYKLYMNGMTNYQRLGEYLTWKMDVVNCNNDLVTKTVSVKLQDYHEDTWNESVDWSFEAQDFPQQIYDIQFSRYDGSTPDVTKGKFSATVPDSIIGKQYAQTGDMVSLSVRGGNLTTGSNWYWFKDGCERGNPIDSGATVNIRADKTTTYFVCSRKDGVSNTGCISKRIIVNDSSYAAVKIIGNNSACYGQNNKQKLKVYGGHLGLDAKWVWYEGQCGQSSAWRHEGDEFEINPNKPTTYFVRAEGRVNKTECIEFSVDFMDNSQMPTAIMASKDEVCQNSPVVLSVQGGKLSKDAKWEWFKMEDNATSKQPISQHSATITDNPMYNTTYYVRAKGFCFTTQEASTNVSVKNTSTDPTLIRQEKAGSSYKKFKLSLVGGMLGEDNAEWVWTVNNKVIHEGKDAEFTYKTKSPVTVYVQGKGDCASTRTVNTYLNPRRPQGVRFNHFFINGGLLLNKADSMMQYTLTIGGKHWYLRGKFSIDTAVNNKKATFETDGIGLTDYFGTSPTSFNGRVYAKRTSATFGLVTSGRHLRYYIGFGYGIRQLLYGANIGSSTVWAKHTGLSYEGLEAETGLMLKFGFINIMGGISGIRDTKSQSIFLDADLGVGLSF
ncbi:MAG: hypothetical protein ACKO5C_05760 [Ferruginibacter sp.]